MKLRQICCFDGKMYEMCIFFSPALPTPTGRAYILSQIFSRIYRERREDVGRKMEGREREGMERKGKGREKKG